MAVPPKTWREVTILATRQQEVKLVLAASYHRQHVRQEATAMEIIVMPTEELVQIRTSHCHAHSTAWTVSKVPEPSVHPVALMSRPVNSLHIPIQHNLPLRNRGRRRVLFLLRYHVAGYVGQLSRLLQREHHGYQVWKSLRATLIC